VEVQASLSAVLDSTALATALRLSFHDCVGGCNGCLNVNNPDNRGLEDLVQLLDTVYKKNDYHRIISRADLWALAGILAVDKTIEANNLACQQKLACQPNDLACLADDCFSPPSGLVFQYGRADCPSSPYFPGDEGLPAATMGHKGVMDFFAEEFGFTVAETVALLGAHTLGKTTTKNSGFNGSWVEGGEGHFNNEYYKKLVDGSIGWVQVDNTLSGTTRHWQWDAPGVAFMLNVDMALFKDIQVDEEGKSSCTFNTCSLVPEESVEEVVEYAEDNPLWIREFTAVYTKVLAHGSTTLKDLPV